MWTFSLALQAVAWTALTCLSPFIFFFCRKASRYLAYRIFPKSVIIEYRTEGKVTEAFYVKRSFFGSDNVIPLNVDWQANPEKAP